jgi:hypothetical protein
MKKAGILFGIIFCLILFGIINFVSAADCGIQPWELCYGYMLYSCSWGTTYTCNDFPRCTLSGQYGGGSSCHNHCHDLGPADNCDPDSSCLCFNESACPLCTYQGQDLSSCNDNSNGGCGPSDTTPPVVNILSPSSSPTYTSSYYPIRLAGNASDDTIITKISWLNNRNRNEAGGSGYIFNGPSSSFLWGNSYVNLEPGLNIINVSVFDGSGNKGLDIINITYDPSTQPNYPIVNLTENSTSYRINITSPYTLNVSYSWSTKPNVYFLLPFAADDNPVLSNLEKQRYRYLIENISKDWDRLTEYKHPMNFYFVEPFLLDSPQAYNSTQNRSTSYTLAAMVDFEDKYPYQCPASLYVYISPNLYFPFDPLDPNPPASAISSRNPAVFANLDFFYLFDDKTSIDNELLRDNLEQGLVTCFSNIGSADLPGQDDDWYLRNNYPGSFKNTIDYGYYNQYYSPTKTEGYYEVYSITSYGRSNIKQENMPGKTPTLLSTLEKMALGIKSEHEDEPYMFYQANTSIISGIKYINITKILDYNISSKRLHDYNYIERIDNLGHYWDIRFDSPIINLGNTKSFSLSKNNQNGSALLVYAEDLYHPGYFKNFGLNSYSSVNFIDTHAPTKPTNLSNRLIGSNQLNITWNSSIDNMDVHHYAVLRNGVNIANTSNLFYIDTLVLGGSYTYNISAVDFAGNINTSNSITFTFGSNKTTMQQIFSSFNQFNQGSINLNNYTGKIKNWILG